MIRNTESLSMAEAAEYIKKSASEDSGTNLMGFIKKFSKISSNNAKELRKKIKELDLLKVKEEHISKIIDLMPENIQDLNKIFVDVGLEEDEAKKILERVKEFK